MPTGANTSEPASPRSPGEAVAARARSVFGGLFKRRNSTPDAKKSASRSLEFPAFMDDSVDSADSPLSLERRHAPAARGAGTMDAADAAAGASRPMA